MGHGWVKFHNYVITMISQSAQKRQAAPENPYSEQPTITMNGHKLKGIDKLIYLGSTLSRLGHCQNCKSQ